MIDGHWLSLSHLGYNCMKYLPGLNTSYSDALTIISPNVFPWKRLNYFQRSCASPLQCRKKCIHKLLNWHRWRPGWQSSRLQILLPRHVLSDGGTGRGSGYHPEYASTQLLLPHGRARRQTANPCRGHGVGQPWLTRPGICFSTGIALHRCVLSLWLEQTMKGLRRKHLQTQN